MAFELDYEGGEHVLKVMARPEIERLTALATAGAGEDASGRVVTTDRAHGIVQVPAYRQARDGALTRGAAAAGLEVTDR